MAETKEKMVTVMIDKRTGGLRTNGKLYVGKVTVTEEMADDLIRRQNEYLATVDKTNDPSVKLRNQSIEVTRKAFIADPSVYGNHPQFSKVNGMCDPFQLQFVAKSDLEEWKAERLGLYGY